MQRSLFAPDPPTVQASRAAIIALLKARQAEMQAMIELILARVA
jgi:hypothetical protein